MRQYWIVGQYRRLMLQPLDFDFELCDLRLHPANLFFHLCDDSPLLLLDLFESPDLLRLPAGAIRLSFPTPQQNRGKDSQR
jgi:hypothetical protein